MLESAVVTARIEHMTPADWTVNAVLLLGVAVLLAFAARAGYRSTCRYMSGDSTAPFRHLEGDRIPTPITDKAGSRMGYTVTCLRCGYTWTVDPKASYD